MTEELNKLLVEMGISYEQALAIVSFFMLAVIFLAVICLARTIATCKIFKRAGIPWTYNFVPIGRDLYFSQIVFGKMRYAWLNLSFVIYSVFAIGIARLNIPTNSIVYTITGVLEIITLGAALYYRVAFCWGLSHSFKKGIGTSIGLFVSPTLFRIILLHGSSHYEGAGEFPMPGINMFIFKKSKKIPPKK